MAYARGLTQVANYLEVTLQINSKLMSTSIPYNLCELGESCCISRILREDDVWKSAGEIEARPCQAKFSHAAQYSLHLVRRTFVIRAVSLVDCFRKDMSSLEQRRGKHLFMLTPHI